MFIFKYGYKKFIVFIAFIILMIFLFLHIVSALKMKSSLMLPTPLMMKKEFPNSDEEAIIFRTTHLENTNCEIISKLSVRCTEYGFHR